MEQEEGTGMVKRERTAVQVAEEMHETWKRFERTRALTMNKLVELANELKGYKIDKETSELVEKMLTSVGQYMAMMKKEGGKVN
jgi:hypothetical protein